MLNSQRNQTTSQNLTWWHSYLFI